MMKRLIFVTLCLFFVEIAVSKNKYEILIYNVVDSTYSSGGSPHLITQREVKSPYQYIVPQRVPVTRVDEPHYAHVRVSEPGELAAKIGEDIDVVDSLVVEGPINSSDFETMWRGTYYGNLSVINLAGANIEDGTVPDDAFIHFEEQLSPDGQYINVVRLRRIILPEGLREIGARAFSYATLLEAVNMPSTLRRIRRYCFSECINLNVDPLEFPEGFEYIDNLAFLNCRKLTGQVVLPSTIKRIGGGAFFQSKITGCNFPDGLEEIGDAAFYACRLKEAVLPNSCQTLSGASHFQLNYELEKVVFPEGIVRIPDSFTDNCLMLREFSMPKSVEEIGSNAFWQCEALTDFELPPHLISIEAEGLYYCKSLKSIFFPSSLTFIGAESCENWKNIESIYCASPEPPECDDSFDNPGSTPFGSYNSDFPIRTPENTPVYVPVGCADKYRNAWGWDYFTNIIEYDFSGVEHISADVIDDESDVIYDLMGRRVDNPIENHLYIKNGKKYISKKRF